MSAYQKIKQLYIEQLQKIRLDKTYEQRIYQLFNEYSSKHKDKLYKYYQQEFSQYYAEWEISNPRYEPMFQRVLELMDRKDFKGYIFTVAEYNTGTGNMRVPTCILFFTDNAIFLSGYIGIFQSITVLGNFMKTKFVEDVFEYDSLMVGLNNIFVYQKKVLAFNVECPKGLYTVFSNANLLYLRNMVDEVLNKKTNEIKSETSINNFCTKCGSKIVSGMNFCGKCGQKLN